MGVSYSAGTLVRTGVERATLVRRTYTLVFVSILTTIAGAAFAFTQPALLSAVARHPFLTFILTLAPLFLAMSKRDVFPANIGLTMLFAAMEGVWLAPVLLLYDRTAPGVVMQAGILTVGAFAVLTVYAFVSRRDFSAWGSFFTTGLFVLFGALLLNYFFHNATAQLWLAAVGLVVFSGLVVYDTWRIRNVYGPDDYVQAAVSLYLDLLNMFLFILTLLGGDRRR